MKRFCRRWSRFDGEQLEGPLRLEHDRLRKFVPNSRWALREGATSGAVATVRF